MANNKKVIFLPDWTSGNPYQSILSNSLRDKNYQVSLKNYDPKIFGLFSVAKNNTGTDVIHIHWINDYIGHFFWTKSTVRFYVKLIRLFLDCSLVRLSGVKIVWTVHNLTSHQSVDIEKERLIRKMLALSVNKMVFHSQSARLKVESFYKLNLKKHSYVIPHVSYVGVYPEVIGRELMREKLKIEKEALVILFFGNIKKYKGVAELLMAFNQTRDNKLVLLIAGFTKDQDTVQMLNEYGQLDERIVIHLGFVKDNEVGDYFACADVVAVPLLRTLTSGSIVLAMSQGKAVISSSESQVLDLLDEEGSFIYDNPAELVSIISRLDRRKLKAMGEYNYKSITRCSPTFVADKLANVYDAAIG